MLLACWQFNGKSKSKFGGENEQQELLDDIEKADYLVAHNAKFELQWLKRCGTDLRAVRVFDTMLAEWVLLGNERSTGLSLQESCKRRGLPTKEDLVSKLIKQGVNPENIPKRWLKDYCEIDVDITKQLFLSQREELERTNRLHLVYQRGLVCACLSDVEYIGISLDKARVEDEYNKVLSEYVETQEALEKEYGQINWRSRKQVAELLYDSLQFREVTDKRGNPVRTDKGDRATDKATISALVPTNQKQREFVQHFKALASLNAKLTKSLEFFKGVCDLYESRFYGIFNQGTTATHRLSSSGRKIKLPKSILSDKESSQGKETEKGIQLQNMPREYKHLVVASYPEWELTECDASTLEFSVAADLGKDSVAKQEISDGVDIHANTAKFFLEDGTQPEFRGLSTIKEARQVSKGHSFKPLFGGRGITKAEQAYCKYFQNKYKGIYDTQTEWTHQVYRSGELITPYGMRFYWPKGRLDQRGNIANLTNIYDYPVQGFATGEIIPLILWNVWQQLDGLKARIILTIHDSIVVEHPKEERDKVREILVSCFTKEIYTQLKEIYNYEFTTRLGCEVKTSTHWGEGQGEKFKAFS